MTRTTFLAAIFVTFGAAQPAADAVRDLGAAWKENAVMLRQYSYKRRTTVSLDGKSRGARVELVRYVDGRMETVPLEGPQRPAEPARGGGLRARMAQKKREEMKEEVEGLNSLLQRYRTFDSDSLQAALEKATISKTGSDSGNTVKVSLTGVLKPSDSLTLTWSITNRRPERIEIRTELEGKPVSASLEYASLPGGPFYAARTVVSDAKRNINITIDTYDYKRDSEAR